MGFGNAFAVGLPYDQIRGTLMVALTMMMSDQHFQVNIKMGDFRILCIFYQTNRTINNVILFLQKRGQLKANGSNRIKDRYTNIHRCSKINTFLLNEIEKRNATDQRLSRKIAEQNNKILNPENTNPYSNRGSRINAEQITCGTCGTHFQHMPKNVKQLISIVQRYLRPFFFFKL